MVVVKLALSIDGRIATDAGTSRWISAGESRAVVAEMRGAAQAVVVGVGTVLADDPGLLGPSAPGPVPVVFDTHGRTPSGARLTQGPQRALLVTGPNVADRADAQVVRVVVGADGHVDAAAGLDALGARGLDHVLVEGGGGLVRGLLDAGRVDRVVVFVAGVWLPGGRAAAGGPSVAALEALGRWQLVDLRRVGPDAMMTWEPPKHRG